MHPAYEWPDASVCLTPGPSTVAVFVRLCLPAGLGTLPRTDLSCMCDLVCARSSGAGNEYPNRSSMRRNWLRRDDGTRRPPEIRRCHKIARRLNGTSAVCGMGLGMGDSRTFESGRGARTTMP